MANVWDTKASNYDTNYGSSQVFSDVFNKGTQGIGYDWSSAPLQNINWNQTLTPARSDAPSWMDFGKAALDIASKWRGTPSSGSSRSSDSDNKMQSISSPGSEISDLGSGYRLIQRAPIVKQKSKSTESGGSSGLGGAIGTIAGIGASFIPGVGPAAAAAMPALGGSVGSLFG